MTSTDLVHMPTLPFSILSDGAQFNLSRNETDVLSIGMDGALSVLSDPLQVSSAVSSANGAPLELRSSGGDGVLLQDQQTTRVNEVDGTTAWSKLNVLVHTGDTVHWSWTNYHNVVQIDEAGALVVAKPPLGPTGERRKAGKVKGLIGRREHAVGVLKVAAQAGQVTVAELEHWRLEGGGKHGGKVLLRHTT